MQELGLVSTVGGPASRRDIIEFIRYVRHTLLITSIYCPASTEAGNTIEQMLRKNVPRLAYIDNWKHSVRHTDSQSRPAFDVLLVSNGGCTSVSPPQPRHASVGTTHRVPSLRTSWQLLWQIRHPTSRCN